MSFYLNTAGRVHFQQTLTKVLHEYHVAEPDSQEFAPAIDVSLMYAEDISRLVDTATEGEINVDKLLAAIALAEQETASGDMMTDAAVTKMAVLVTLRRLLAGSEGAPFTRSQFAQGCWSALAQLILSDRQALPIAARLQQGNAMLGQVQAIPAHQSQPASVRAGLPLPDSLSPGLTRKLVQVIGSEPPPKQSVALTRPQSDMVSNLISHPEGQQGKPDSTWRGNTYGILDFVFHQVGNSINRVLGRGTDKPKWSSRTGLEGLAVSGIVPKLTRVTTVEQGRQIYADVNREEMRATHDYTERTKHQLQQLPASVMTKYEEALTETIAAYLEEQEPIRNYFGAVETAGIPDASRVNKAIMALDHAVRQSTVLARRGIGPLEFQILMKRNEYLSQQRVVRDLINRPGRTADQLEKARQKLGFLRTRAFGQEFTYIMQTFAHEVTCLMTEIDAEKNQPRPDRKRISEMKGLISDFERLSHKALDVYERMVEGSELHSTDKTTIALLRSLAFPFEMTAGEEFLGLAEDKQSPAYALAQLDEARAEFDRQSESFILGTYQEARAKNEAAQHASMRREKADFVFQMARLKAELDRLKQAVGTKLDPEDEVYFQKNFQAYQTAFADYMNYWEGFLDGDDVEAREHERNGLDKKVAFHLVFGAQWALNDLYTKYGLTTRSENPLKPSAISFSYVNQMRLMDQAIQQGFLTREAMHTFYKRLPDYAPIIAQEIGIHVGDVFRIMGREHIDISRIDAIGGSFGYTQDSAQPQQYIIHGLESSGYMVGAQAPHQDVMAMEGARAVYPDEDFTNKSAWATFFRANHNGIREFWTNVALGLLGIATPQQAQSGAADVPIFGDYLKGRTVIIDRATGSDDPNRNPNSKIVRFLMREMNLLSYTAGTRIVSVAGGHPLIDYAGDPSQVFALRIITDHGTSGQDAKIFGQMNKMAGGTGHGVLVQNLVHDGNKTVPEPTWFLGGPLLEMFLGNSSAKTSLNFSKANVPTHVGFGTALSSSAYPTLIKLKSVFPKIFTSSDGEPRSARESYVLALQVPSEVMTAAMSLDALGLELAPSPAQTEQQKRNLRKYATKPLAEKRQLVLDGMALHLRNRRASLAKAVLHRGGTVQPVLSEQERKIADLLVGKSEVLPAKGGKQNRVMDVVAGAEKTALDKLLAPARVKELLQQGGFYLWTDGTYDPTKRAHQEKIGNFKGAVIDERALPFIIEAMQRGYQTVPGQIAGEEPAASDVALDGDKVLWDHFFQFGNNTPSLLQNLVDHYVQAIDGADQGTSSPRQDNGARLIETININPLWLAYMIGYAEANKGKAPILFSSGIASRLVDLSHELSSNQLVKRFFQVLLGIEDVTPAVVALRLSKEQLLKDYRAYRDAQGPVPRVITREIIAEHVDYLMTRFANNNFSLDDSNIERFTEAEKIDIEGLLFSNGDLHLKLASLIPYRILVDDRTGNAKHAARYKGVSVYQPEPFSESELTLYGTTTIEAQHKIRLSAGRSGQALDIMRMMAEPESEGRLNRSRRQDRPARIPGLFDQPVTLAYPFGETRLSYRGAEKKIRRVVLAAKRALAERAANQRSSHHQAKIELVRILSAPDTFIVKDENSGEIIKAVPVAGVRIKNALKILAPGWLRTKKGSQGLTKAEHFEQVQWPLSRIPNTALRERALAELDILRRRDLVNLNQKTTPVQSRKKGMMRWLATAKKVMRVLNADFWGTLTVSMNSLVGDRLRDEIKVSKFFTNFWEQFLLTSLGREMQGKLFLWKLSSNQTSQARGIAAKLILLQVFDAGLERLPEWRQDLAQRLVRLSQERLDYFSQHEELDITSDSYDVTEHHALAELDARIAGVRLKIAHLGEANSQKEQIRGYLTKLAGELGDCVFEASETVDHALKLAAHAKSSIDTVAELWRETSLGDVVQDRAIVKSLDFIKVLVSVLDRRMVELVKDKPDMGTQSHVLYLIFDVIQDLAGEGTVVAQMMGVLKEKLSQTGFGHFIVEAKEMYDDYLALQRKDDSVEKVVKLLTSGELGSVEDWLVKEGNRFVELQGGYELGMEKWRALVRSAWLQVQPAPDDLLAAFADITSRAMNRVKKNNEAGPEDDTDPDSPAPKPTPTRTAHLEGTARIRRDAPAPARTDSAPPTRSNGDGAKEDKYLRPSVVSRMAQGVTSNRVMTVARQARVAPTSAGTRVTSVRSIGALRQARSLQVMRSRGVLSRLGK